MPCAPRVAATVATEPEAQLAGEGPTPKVEKESVVIREATVEDVERIESLTLEDFATDFSKVPIPDGGGPIAESEMKTAVDNFLNSLERG